MSVSQSTEILFSSSTKNFSYGLEIFFWIFNELHSGRWSWSHCANWWVGCCETTAILQHTCKCLIRKHVSLIAMLGTCFELLCMTFWKLKYCF